MLWFAWHGWTSSGQGDNRLGVPIILPLDPQDRRLTRGGSCLLAVDVRIEKSSCSVRIELSSLLAQS